MNLTIGMAHFNDFDGVYFSIQALRLYQDCKDVEFLVVDNSPDTPAGKAVKDFLKAVPNSRYIPAPETVGTSAPRDRIFREATGEAVLCMDCHVLLVGNSIARLKNWYDSNPDNMDLVTGPLVYDNLQQTSTHFDLQWRGGMWGTWGSAWACQCGAHFTILAGEGEKAQVHDLVDIGIVATEGKCLQCGKTFPDVPYANHQPSFSAAGFRPLGAGPNEPPFEIPAQGLGLFTCRKSAWLGFNPAFRGFGGEEGYIHIKYRQAGRHCLSLPFLGWGHRFFRSGGASYAPQVWDKVRNYVIGHQEIGLPLDAIHQHFVVENGEQGRLTDSQWENLMADPIGHILPPGGCGTCGGQIAPETTLEDLYKKAVETPSDINEHAPKLRELASQSKVVVEFGHRRGVSTASLLAGQPEILTSYDLQEDQIWKALQERQGNTKFTFIRADVTQVDIPECDLLFEDSRHTAEHIYAILSNHAAKVRRWMAFHDTVIFGETGEDGGPGILPALRRFMREHPEWSVIYHSVANHGFTVLGKLPEDKPKLPSMPRMVWNYAKAMAKHQVTGAKLASTEKIEARLDVCLTCPLRTTETGGDGTLNRCSACGCYLDAGPNDAEAKAMWDDSECPLGKWVEQ